MATDDTRTEELRDRVRALEQTLSRISEDSCYHDWKEGGREACSCPPCEARTALESPDADGLNWRYRGAMHARVQGPWNPRERKIILAWSKSVGDERLATILDSRNNSPTARDWYVASSVVQWLATNVGMSVLENAGFKYTQFEEDAKRRPRS